MGTPRHRPRLHPRRRPTHHPQTLLNANNTLYLVQPLKSAQRLSVVYGGLLGSLLKDQAYDHAHTTGQPLPNLLTVVDEAANTPLQWLPTVASTCAGIGILLITVWQSKAQIDALYQKQADPLLTNHSTKIFYTGISDTPTLDYVTYLAGEEEAPSQAISTTRGGSRTTNQIPKHHSLIPTELLRQAPPGHALLIHNTLPPAHLEMRRYW